MKLLFSLLVLIASVASGATFKTIPAKEAQILVRNSACIVIDIRTPEEFNEERIDSAINIDFYDPDFEQKIDKLDKSDCYLIYCRSGPRTSQAMKIFKKLGFSEVYELDGGILAWKKLKTTILK